MNRPNPPKKKQKKGKKTGFILSFLINVNTKDNVLVFLYRNLGEQSL